MKKNIIISVFVIVGSVAAVACIHYLYKQEKLGTSEKPVLTEDAAREQLKGMPLSFQENLGQTDPEVKFVMRGSSQSIFFTADGIVYSFFKKDESDAQKDPLKPETTGQPQQMLAIRQGFVDANVPTVTGQELLEGKVNYFIGNDKEKWRTGIPTFAAVKYENVYDGINAVYSGKQGALSYEYTVQPKSDPASMLFRFEGIDGLEVAKDGSLSLATAFGKIGVQRPVAYQMVSGQRVPVAVSYEIKDGLSYGFKIANFNPDYPLLITNAS